MPSEAVALDALLELREVVAVAALVPWRLVADVAHVLPAGFFVLEGLVAV